MSNPPLSSTSRIRSDWALRSSSSSSFDLEPAGELLENVAHHFGGENDVATGDVVQHLHDLGGTGSFDEIADRAGSEHLQHAGPVFVGREGDHPGLEGSDPDLARRPRASAGGHLHVQQGNVRMFAQRELDRLLGVLGDADELERLLGLDELGKGGKNDRLVVRHQHTNSIQEDFLSALVRERRRRRSDPDPTDRTKDHTRKG